MIRPRTAFASLAVAASLAASVVPAAAGAASPSHAGKYCGHISQPGPICHPPALP
jgi:hypothetical protein